MHSRVEKILATDGGIVSAPGLKRINLLPENAELLDWMLPAPAQGVMAVIGRDSDPQLEELIGKINHHETFICAQVERDFMSSVEAGCASPLGAFCQPIKGGFTFEGALLSLDGRRKFSIRRLSPMQVAGSWTSYDSRNTGQWRTKQWRNTCTATQRRVMPEEIDKTNALALDMGLKLHDIEVLDLVPMSFEIKAADIAMVEFLRR